MIVKEHYCNNDEGAYIYKFNKKEVGRTDLRVECTYEKIKTSKYKVEIYVGIEAFDLLERYSAKTIDSNFRNLKSNMKVYVQNEINSNTLDKLNKFIKEKVIPKPDYFSLCVGKIYKIVSPSGKEYNTYLYTDKVIIREIESGNETGIYGEYDIEEVVSLIKKQEEVS